MNGLYNILLFLFIFGAVSQSINELQVFSIHIPQGDARISSVVVTDLQNSSSSKTPNDFSVIEVVISFMRVIGMGVMCMFTVIPLIIEICTSVGADPTFATVMAGMLQAPITFVTLFGLYEFWTGRSVT